jgi:DNA-binding GntR family transcriptional regulator
MSFLTFPKLPTDWSHKEKVRVFVIALATSKSADQLTKLTSTQWDDNFRTLVAALAGNKQLWDTAWDILHSPDDHAEKIVVPRTFRERIRNRFARTTGVLEPCQSASIENVEYLMRAILTVKLVFAGKNMSL